MVNDKRPVIQTQGYNGSEPTRMCPHCGKEKPLSDFGYRNMGNDAIRNQSWCITFSGYRLFAQRLSVGVAAGRKTGEHLLGERMQ